MCYYIYSKYAHLHPTVTSPVFVAQIHSCHPLLLTPATGVQLSVHVQFPTIQLPQEQRQRVPFTQALFSLPMQTQDDASLPASLHLQLLSPIAINYPLNTLLMLIQKPSSCLGASFISCPIPAQFYAAEISVFYKNGSITRVSTLSKHSLRPS